MKINCADCKFSKPTGCEKNSKNGYNNCNKFRSIPIDQLKKEMQDLMVSKKNPARLEYITNKLINLNGGTI